MVVSLFLSLAVDCVLCFSVPRCIIRVTSKSQISMNIFGELVKIEQDKISVRREELALEEKKLSQGLELEEKKMCQELALEEKNMRQRKYIATLGITVSIFAIVSFLVFSVQLKDGLLGQTTSVNSSLKSLSNSFNELKVWIGGGLTIITGIVSFNPLCNVLNKFYNILRTILLKIKVQWRTR